MCIYKVFDVNSPAPLGLQLHTTWLQAKSIWVLEVNTSDRKQQQISFLETEATVWLFF